MKKIIFTLIAVAATTFIVSAQAVLNGDFETWLPFDTLYDEPLGFGTYNSLSNGAVPGFPEGVKKSTDKRGGLAHQWWQVVQDQGRRCSYSSIISP